MVAETTLAERLSDAIRKGESLALPTLVEPGLDEAYRIQRDILQRLELEPVGYKLSLRETGVLSAPLLSVGQTARVPFQPGMKLEVELALHLAADLPPRAGGYTREAVARSIDGVFLGIELVRSRYEGGAQGRIPFLLADLMSSAGYLIGPPLPDAILDQDRFEHRLRVDLETATVFDAVAAHPDGDPLAALTAYANRHDRPADVLKAGMVLTTGSLCGGLPVAGPVGVTVLLLDRTYRFEIVDPA